MNTTINIRDFGTSFRIDCRLVPEKSSLFFCKATSLSLKDHSLVDEDIYFAGESVNCQSRVGNPTGEASISANGETSPVCEGDNIQRGGSISVGESSTFFSGPLSSGRETAYFKHEGSHFSSEAASFVGEGVSFVSESLSQFSETLSLLRKSLISRHFHATTSLWSINTSVNSNS